MRHRSLQYNRERFRRPRVFLFMPWDWKLVMRRLLITNLSHMRRSDCNLPLSNVYLTSNKFGLNVIPPSTKFIQCQTTIGTALKQSPNESMTHLWKSTNNHINVQYTINTTRQRTQSSHSKKCRKINFRISCHVKDHSSPVS